MTSPIVTLRAPDGATAQVHHDGAHVTSWRPASDGEERLFLSDRTELREGVAIRGGIPVIFPQFAAEGPLPRHGFARTMRWTLEYVSENQPFAAAVFRLRDSESTRKLWNVAFAASVAVRIQGDELRVQLVVANHGREAMRFTAALHTYLRVADIRDVSLTGLQGTRYRESGAPGVLRVDERAALRPSGEVDRVYVDAPSPLTLREPGRSLKISSEAFPDVVVWNPGATKAAALADMEPGGERRMLCVEAAAVQRPVEVAACETWMGTQRLQADS